MDQLYVVNNMRDDRIYLAQDQDHALELAKSDGFVRKGKNDTYRSNDPEANYKPSSVPLDIWLAFASERRRGYLPGLYLQASNQSADLLSKIPAAAAKRADSNGIGSKVQGWVIGQNRYNNFRQLIRTPVVGGIALYEINDEYERLSQITAQLTSLGVLMGWKEVE